MADSPRAQLWCSHSAHSAREASRRSLRCSQSPYIAAAKKAGSRTALRNCLASSSPISPEASGQRLFEVYLQRRWAAKWDGQGFAPAVLHPANLSMLMKLIEKWDGKS